MKKVLYIAFCLAGMSILSCFWSSNAVKLGENRLTIDLLSRGKQLNIQASVYINAKFIGMTSPQGDLAIKLAPGEYSIRIAREGFESWEESILIVGKGYAQSLYPDMKKVATNWSAENR